MTNIDLFLYLWVIIYTIFKETMSKILLFTDLHWWADVSMPVVGTVGSRFRQTIDAILRYTEENNVSQIINLWDTWIVNADIEKNREVSRYIQSVLWKFQLETILWNHCFWSLGWRTDNNFYQREATPKIIQLGPTKQWILFDDIDYDKYGYSKATDRSLDDLDSIVGWLTQEALLFSHYPVTDDSNNTFFGYHTPNQWTFLSNSWEVREIIKWSKIIRVLNWHVHKYFQTEIGGISHTTIPSVSNNYDGFQKGEVWVYNTESWELEIVDLFREAA